MSKTSKIWLYTLLLFSVFLSLYYIRKDAQEFADTIQRIEQIDRELDIRNSANEAIKENYKLNPERDGSVALDRLRKKYGNSNKESGG